MKFVGNVIRGIAALAALMLTSVAWREHKRQMVAAQPKEERFKGEPGILETSIDLAAPALVAWVTWVVLGRLGRLLPKRGK